MNVVKIDTHVGFDVATVNFYLQGLSGDKNVRVYQYVDYNNWTEVSVKEVRAEHVVADLTSTGVFAFIQEP